MRRLGSFLFLLCLPALSQGPDWRYHARRLTGFSETTQQQSLRALKNTKNLEKQVVRYLGTGDRYLALDVISTLSMTGTLDALFEWTTRDESGAVVLAINALLNSETRPRIVEHYRKIFSRLSVVPLSVPSTMAVLDVMGRLKERLGEDELEAFMESPHAAIRSAAVYYTSLIRRSDPSAAGLYRAVLERAVIDPAESVRVQTRLALDALPLPPVSSGWWVSFKRLFTRPTWRHRPLNPPAPRDLITSRPHPAKQTAKQVKTCQKTYERVFRDPTLQVRVVFGYKDARPSRFVGDRYEAEWFASYLTSPCRIGWHACGFAQEKSDPSHYRKKILGPDDKIRNIELQLVHSSAGPDDDENRIDPFQKWLSERARTVLLGGLEMADVVFYSGHSRDGGGPDYAPPRLTADQHVEYQWYEKNRPGFNEMMDRLQGESALQLLGFFSCASTGHFVKEFRSGKIKPAMITSPKLIYYADAMRNMLAALSALLGEECEIDFDASLRSRAEVGNSHLIGFFGN